MLVWVGGFTVSPNCLEPRLYFDETGLGLRTASLALLGWSRQVLIGAWLGFGERAVGY